MTAKLEVVIAGAGVAGLEALLALRALAGERVAVTLVAPEAQAVLPTKVGQAPLPRIAVADVAADAGARHVQDSFRWLDAADRVVHTRAGCELPYDAFLLALGARRRAEYRHALTLEAHRLSTQVGELSSALQAGALSRVVLLAGPASGWTAPIYELALLLCRQAREHDTALEATVVTAEDAPLAAFGRRASDAAAELLTDAGVAVITSALADVAAPGVVRLRPAGTVLRAERVIALPAVHGPSTPGVAKRARGGFISIDPYGCVRSMPSVYAAGDATDFPVKCSAVAAQQADMAAASIAGLAGASLELTPLAPLIEGTLPAGGGSLPLSARLVGGQPHRSRAGPAASRRLPATVPALHLARYLESHTPGRSPRAAVTPRADDATEPPAPSR